jgi:hypothetical protein
LLNVLFIALLIVFNEGRGKKEEGRRKREEGRGKKEEGRRKSAIDGRGGFTPIFST